jgi:site-specific DNA-methyltransferase (adenine-specific)
MSKMVNKSIDLIITSPPYNSSRLNTNDPYNTRYDKYQDKMSNEQYIDWTKSIFDGYNNILKTDGCILYNMSYSSQNVDLMWLVVSEIIRNTPFMVVDCIIWKKNNAIPNNVSKNKLTRIIEYIFVICRKDEVKTFNTNKKVVSNIEKTSQNIYENIYNFIEAKNNDGSNKLNKATFSTELVSKLLDIYALPGSVVYDSFMGIGTTAKACIIKGFDWIGSELSSEQIEYFQSEYDRLKISKIY